MSRSRPSWLKSRKPPSSFNVKAVFKPSVDRGVDRMSPSHCGFYSPSYQPHGRHSTLPHSPCLAPQASLGLSVLRAGCGLGRAGCREWKLSHGRFSWSRQVVRLSQVHSTGLVMLRKLVWPSRQPLQGTPSPTPCQPGQGPVAMGTTSGLRSPMPSQPQGPGMVVKHHEHRRGAHSCASPSLPVARKHPCHGAHTHTCPYKPAVPTHQLHWLPEGSV